VPSQTPLFESASGAARSSPGVAVDVVLLSDDIQIFEAIRNAVSERHPIWRAHTADEAIELLVSGRCGVLVIDLGTLSIEPTSLVRQVTQQFPDVVVVVAGRQADEHLLAGMISDGLVYRFMHKPLSPKRAGMFLGAAMRCHAERRESPGVVATLLPMVGHLPEGADRRRWLVAGALGAALLLGLVLYLISGDEPDSSTASRVPPDGSAVQATNPSPDAVLARARAALAGGQLESPEGGNALDLYRAVLLSQPEHAEARAGLERAAGLVLAQAHAEAGANRGDEARRLVRRVLATDPANAVALAMQARLETPPAGAGVAVNASSRRTAAAAWFDAARPARPATQAPQTRETAARLASLPAGPPGAGPGVGAGAATQPPPALGDPAGNALPAGRASALGTPIAAGAAAAGLATVGPGGAVAPPAEDARAETPSAANPAGSGPSLVPLREFKRVSMTEPTYPAEARRDGTEGWVRLQFTVTERGQVRDIVIVGAEPSGVFEGAAAEALQRWRFRPPVAPDGQPVALRSSVVLRFELEN